LEKSFINTLNGNEQKILNRILLNCAVKMSKILSQHQNSREYAKFLEKVIGKKTYVVGMKLFAELPNINSEVLALDNISDPTFSKVYGEFEDRKLLKNYTDKKNLKKIRTQEFLTKGEKRNYKTGGRISFYQKEPIIDEARELLSKPGAKEYILDILNDYDSSLVDKFLELIFITFFYLLQNHEMRMELLVKSVHNYDKNKQIDVNTFEKGKNFCLSLPEQEIEKMGKISVKAIKKEPFFSIIIFMLLVL
jgi:hypothetical protein